MAKKVIFITGDASDPDTRQFIAMSNNPVVLKPFHLDDVCRQVLNVVESVFSGLARAVLHNSDYQSVMECKEAIDRHFDERNQNFRANPKMAGNKIWGKERVPAVFSESNNCKDPRW